MRRLAAMALIGAAMVGLGIVCVPFGYWQIGLCAVGLMTLAAATPRYINCSIGLAGEKRVAKVLRLLPDEYTTIANWTNGSGKGGDTDIVIVGPAAVIALEVKTWTFTVLLENDKCYQVFKNGYRKSRKSPITQAKRNAMAASKALQLAGIKNQVLPMVVFNNRADLEVVNCSIHVCKAKNLVASIQQVEGTSTVDQERVIDALASQQ